MNENLPDKIRDNIKKNIKFDVTVVLGEKLVKLSDIDDLKVGNEIFFDTDSEQEAKLYINEKLSAAGKIFQEDGKLVFKVVKVLI